MRALERGEREGAMLEDAIVACTDRAMEGRYEALARPGAAMEFLSRESLEAMNLLCAAEEAWALAARLPDRFFLIAGSSNFHHLEVARLVELAAREPRPVHLLLLDRHMDAQKFFEEGAVLTCGNWVSCAVRRGLVRSATLCGCDDETRDPAFDRELFADGRVAHHRDLSLPLDARRLEGCAIYVSVDTDLLDVPSDWGRGKVALSALLEAPLWEQLRKAELCGAGIMGHVTDGRFAADMLAASFRRRGLVKKLPSLAELWADFATGFLPKVRAGLARPLPLERQLEIVLSIHRKIADIAQPRSSDGAP